MAGPLFAAAEADCRIAAMRESVAEIEDALAKLGKGSPPDTDTKVSDDFMTPLFQTYFGKLQLPNLIAKKNFHELARHVPPGELDPEVEEKLDAVVAVAAKARPMEETT